jgi:SP family arabinose:H+ symporter-like MFS transporter
MKNNVLWISLAAACGGLLFGFDTAVIAGVTPFIQPYFQLDELGLGWAVSCVLIGCAVGTQLAGKPSDMLGRKKTLLGTAVLFLIGALSSALAVSFQAFLWFRILGGVGVGAASVLSPIYIAEIAPPKLRGRLVSTNQLALVIGILIAFFSNYFLAGMGDDNWRWMLGIGAVPAFMFLVFLLFMPESPYWLFSKGQYEEARQVLNRLMLQEEAVGEWTRMQQAVQEKRTGSIRELMAPKYRRWLIAGILLAAFQQATGINAILYYAPVIFEQAGSGTDVALLQTVAVGFVNLLFTLIAMFTIDRIGRRPLLLAGEISMAGFLLLLSGVFFMGKLEGYWVMFFILGFIASFAVSSGPATWVLISEIYPTKVRSLAVSLATLALWISNFAVSYTFPVMLKYWHGGYTFLFYAGINLLAYFFIRARIPETKGKSLEEMEQFLSEQSAYLPR